MLFTVKSLYFLKPCMGYILQYMFVVVLCFVFLWLGYELLVVSCDIYMPGDQ